MTKAAELAKMGEVLSNSQVGRKNIIINGGMQIAQRGTSSTGLGATDGYYTVDRFKTVHGATSAGRYTMTQSAITDLEGFSNGLKLQCTTADTSIAAGELLIVSTSLEGLAVQSLAATSTSTRAFTVSFYAKSNANRAISVETNFADGTNRRAQTLHTIGTSWARYTMTVPAASSTSLPNDNTHSFNLDLWIHAGSNYTSGTMSSSLAAHDNTNRAVGIGSFFSSTDNTLELTGVQIEVGEQATPFEHISYGEELSLCQRYYQVVPKYTFFNGAVEVGSNSLRAGVPITRPFRASPTIGNITVTIYDDDDYSASNAAHAVFANSGSPEVDGTTGYLSVVFNGNLSGRTDNHNVTAMYGTNGTLDAEL